MVAAIMRIKKAVREDDRFGGHHCLHQLMEITGYILPNDEVLRIANVRMVIVALTKRP